MIKTIFILTIAMMELFVGHLPNNTSPETKKAYFSTGKNEFLKEKTSDMNLKFYLLKEYHLQNKLSLAIDETHVVLEDTPFIEDRDIAYYEPANYTFYLTEKKQEELKLRMNKKNELSLKAFALVINNEIIYTGYFWQPYASMYCDWFIINSHRLSRDGVISIELGSLYSEKIPDIEDRRNDKRLLELLKKGEKLR